jgi:KipI family sensor histidine kinase inhibitor
MDGPLGGFEMRSLGDSAVLVDCGTPVRRRRLVALLEAEWVGGRLPDVIDLVAGMQTVAVFLTSPVEVPEAVAALTGLIPRSVVPGSVVPGSAVPGVVAGGTSDVVVPVVYDGDDLVEVADLLGLGVRELVDWHTSQVWTCDLVGFLPGFGYLVCERPRAVPRRPTPRTRIPAGSVALAGEWSGIYPNASPGGWQVIGRTALAMLDAHRDPPALVHAGVRVRFVEATP